MSIVPFLRDQGFGPEVIDAMSAAFKRVCDVMGLTTKRDPATELVARRIIEYAQRGIHDAVTLAEMVKKDFDAAR